MVRTSTRRKRTQGSVALVLGAGGIKGWAHVGVLKVLHEAAVPIDLIVGASAGALIGPLYAAVRDADAMQRTALSFTTVDFTEWFLRGLRIAPNAGLMSRRLWEAYGRCSFEELNVPFAAVAHDLGTGSRLILREGTVARAVEASIRPPFFGRPTRLDNRWLLDGGLQSALPTDVAQGLGATALIAVHLGGPMRLPPPLRPLSAQVGRAFRDYAPRPESFGGQLALVADMMSRDRLRESQPQVEIRPDMTGISAFSPWQIGQAARRGEAAARRALPAIERALAPLRGV